MKWKAICYSKGCWDRANFLLRSERSVLSTGIFLSGDFARKPHLFLQQHRSLNTLNVSEYFRLVLMRFRTKNKLEKISGGFWQCTRSLVDLSAGTDENPTKPQRPLTSWALRGHAMLDEWGQPLTFKTPIIPAVSAMQPRGRGWKEKPSTWRCCHVREGCLVPFRGEKRNFNKSSEHLLCYIVWQVVNADGLG